MHGGKFSMYDGGNPKNEGPSATTYFVLGRSEISQNTGY